MSTINNRTNFSPSLKLFLNEKVSLNGYSRFEFRETGTSLMENTLKMLNICKMYRNIILTCCFDRHCFSTHKNSSERSLPEKQISVPCL